MSVGLDIEMDVRKAVERLSTVGKSINQDALLSGIGKRFLTWINLNFRQGGIEEKWRPISLNTIAARRAGKGPGMNMKMRGAGGQMMNRRVVGIHAMSANIQPLRDTGRLANSFIDKIEGNAVVIGTDIPYAKFHEKGVPPFGPIVPKRGKVLAFMSASGPVFVTRVEHHPGIPQRRLIPTQGLAEKLALETVKAFIDKIIEKTKGR